ncbi:MAG TPA: nucleotide exchange factor GrpE [Bacteroidetes bacterium]|nr:nucleotide exchange factor GrpE [Bacteroidota bacterium]
MTKKVENTEVEKKERTAQGAAQAAAQEESAKEQTEQKGRKKRTRGKVRQLEEQIAKLEAEKAALAEKYLRLAAEFDNFKKLAAREIENRIRAANEELIVDLLPVLDNLERTLDNIPDKKEFKPLKEGIELVYKEFKKVLSKYGLEEIDSVGKEFDYDLHEAIMMVEDKDKPSNTVVQEHQKGYKLNGKVIRHAKVVVNK